MKPLLEQTMGSDFDLFFQREEEGEPTCRVEESDDNYQVSGEY